ncbi:hypothetical protein [Actinophytocola sp.]|uniref:hypothetical protein n=1 Tax=Actinophytocola sp. TaxID=1872138 RepID=UPI00389A15EB
MSERWPWLRWVFLLTAAALVVVFLLAQRQAEVDVSYARSPSGKDTVSEGDAGELSGATLPSVAELTDMLDKDKVVRLPGAVAGWDEARVTRAIGDADIRILVAPPGLTDKQQKQLADVKNATIRIIGTDLHGSTYQVVPDRLAEWRATFVTGDVTGLLLTLIAAERDQPGPPEIDPFSWRAPTAAELDPVANDLRAGGLHLAAGATLAKRPQTAAFGGQRPLVAAFPRQPPGQPVPEYGPTLATLFPDQPILVMYGNWIGYYGPHAGEFADVTAAGFYARFGDRLSGYAYPQANVLGTYLDQVTDVRYAGLFDRPLPYRPLDPLRVALPALPWLFGACVLAFLALSARSVLGPRTAPRTPPGRLAGLTTLAIELSGLSHAPALARALVALQAARSALAENLPDRHVARLLTAARRDLDTVARDLGRAEYRPANYLVGELAWRD